MVVVMLNSCLFSNNLDTKYIDIDMIAQTLRIIMIILQILLSQSFRKICFIDVYSSLMVNWADFISCKNLYSRMRLTLSAIY